MNPIYFSPHHPPTLVPSISSPLWRSAALSSPTLQLCNPIYIRDKRHPNKTLQLATIHYYTNFRSKEKRNKKSAPGQHVLELLLPLGRHRVLLILQRLLDRVLWLYKKIISIINIHTTSSTKKVRKNSYKISQNFVRNSRKFKIKNSPLASGPPGSSLPSSCPWPCSPWTGRRDLTPSGRPRGSRPGTRPVIFIIYFVFFCHRGKFFLVLYFGNEPKCCTRPK